MIPLKHAQSRAHSHRRIWRLCSRLHGVALLVAACGVMGAAPSEAAMLDDVKKRGVLTCGVSEGVPGFSSQGPDGAWSGLDVDFCRALAAAVLGDPSKTKFVPTGAEDRFKQLASGSVDILTRNTSWTFQREIEQGVIFPGVLFFDGQGFMVPRELGLTSPSQLSGAKICVLSGTTSDGNASAYFAQAGLEVEILRFPNRKAAIEAYESGMCDARTGDRSALFAEVLLLAEPARHMVLSDTISKEPLGPAVRSADRDFADIVRWVLFALIQAEDLDLTQAMLQKSDDTRTLAPDQSRFIEESGKLGAKLGLPATWVENVIQASGNYGEVFDRNLGKTSPLGMARGANALWSDGGLMYAPPMP